MAACEHLNLEFREGQTTYRWFGTWVKDYHADDAAYKNGIDPKDFGKCEHAIGIPGDHTSYEIGVVKNPHEEGYLLVLDFYGSGKNLAKLVGQDCKRLAQEYAAQVAIIEAGDLIAQGYQLNRVDLPNGDIEITLTQ